MRAFIAGCCLILYEKVFEIKVMDDPDLSVSVVLIVFFFLALAQDVVEIVKGLWR